MKLLHFYFRYLPLVLLASFILKLLVPGTFAGDVFNVLLYAYYPVYLVAMLALSLLGLGLTGLLFIISNQYGAVLLPLGLLLVWSYSKLKQPKARKPWVPVV